MTKSFSNADPYQQRPIRKSSLAALAVCFIVLSPSWAASPLPTVGCWWKEAKSYLKAPEECDFLLVKTAILSSNGTLSTRTPIPETAVGWITRRLSPLEPLGTQVAIRLADEAAKEKIARIELDLEPMPALAGWLVPFAKEFDRKSEQALHFATPPFAKVKLPGLSWSEKDLRDLLVAADGIDLMIYDTGLSTIESYRDLVRTNAELAVKLLGEFPAKSILLGLPAYPDKTKLHRPSVENLFIAREGLEKIERFPTGLSVAVYAGWTLTGKEREQMRAIKALIEGRRR